MAGLGWTNWLRLFVWLILGMIVYVSYSRHHSVARSGVPVDAVRPGRS
jgi:APA family basic amino acid/polyamine antiporter